MRTFFVAHRKEPDWQETFGKFLALYKYEDFEMVAFVKAKDLEDLFYLTNHVDISWPDHEEVTMLTKDEVRSTSVGDVVVEVSLVEEENVIKFKWHWMMVAGTGWKNLEAMKEGWMISEEKEVSYYGEVRKV